jgi:hypothetical protein
LNNEDIVAWTSNPFLAFDTEAGSLFSMGSWSFGASSSSSMSITAVSFCTLKLRKIKYKFPDNIEYKINEVLNFRLTGCNKKKKDQNKNKTETVIQSTYKNCKDPFVVTVKINAKFKDRFYIRIARKGKVCIFQHWYYGDAKMPIRIFELVWSFTSVSTSTAFSSCSERSGLLLPESSPEEISANLAKQKNYMNMTLIQLLVTSDVPL